MDVNIKDLNKFIGPDGVTVLDEVRVSPTEPAFRQNGYETNEDKKSFALSLDSGNSEYVEFDADIVLSGDYTLEINLDSDINANSQILFSGFPTDISLFGGGKIYYVTDSDPLYLSVNNKLPLSGRFTYKIERVGNDTIFYVDGTQVDSISGYNGDLTIKRMFRIGSTVYFQGKVYYFNIKGENYPLRRGLGVELIGSNGTTAEIKTSAANPQQRVNFGMWLKGDNINGWNPYTV